MADVGRFVSLGEIESLDNFKKLSYEEQVQVRTDWVNKYFTKLPSYATSTEEQRVSAIRALVEAPPSFESDNDYTKSMKLLAEQVLAGDPEAIRKAKDRVYWTESTRTTIIGNIVAGAKSLDEEGDDYKTIYGLDGQKINSMLMSALQRSDATTTREVYELTNAISRGAMAYNMVEGLVTNVGLIGGLGKAGLLTKGLLGETGAVAKWVSTFKPGFAYRTAGALGEQTAQSILSAGLSTAQYTAMDILQNPGTKKSFADIAKGAGAEIAFDWLTWMALSPVIVGTKAMFHSLKGYRGDTTKLVKDISKYGDAEFADSLQKMITGQDLPEGYAESLKANAPEVYENFMYIRAHGNMDMEAAAKGFETPESKAHIIATAAGFGLEADPKGGYVLKPFVTQGVQTRVATLDEAVKFVTSNAGKDVSHLSAGDPTKMVKAIRKISTTIAPTTISSSEVLRKIVEPANGIISRENAKFFVKNLVESSGAATDVGKSIDKFRQVDLAPKDFVSSRNVEKDFAAGIIRHPVDISNANVEKSYREYLEGMARKIAAADPNVKVSSFLEQRIRALEDHVSKSNMTAPGSKVALNNAARQLGMKVGAGKAGTIKLDGVEYPTVEAATRALYSQGVKTGRITIEDLQVIVKRATGLSLNIEKKAASGNLPEQSKVVLRSGKQVVDESATLEDLVANSQYMNDIFRESKLPAHLAPRINIVDASTGDAIIDNGVAYGSAKSLAEFRNNFWSDKYISGKSYKFIDDINGKQVVLDTKSVSFEVYDPDIGVLGTFESAASAKKFVNDASLYWSNMKKQMEMRGIHSFRDPSGALNLVDTNGKITQVRTEADFNQFAKDHPIPGSKVDLIDDTDNPQFAEIATKNERVVEIKNEVGSFRKWINSKLESPGLSMVWAPAEAFFERVKNPALVKGFREMQSAIRHVNVQNVKTKPYVDAIWKDVNQSDYPYISLLMEVEESAWDNLAVTIRGTPGGAKFQLTPEIRQAAKRSADFYKTFAKAYGLVDANSLRHYAPHLVSYANKIKSIGQAEPPLAKDFIKEAFGADIPRDLNFFAENMRTDAFLDMVNDQNPYRAMMRYVDATHKKVFLRGALEHTKNVFTSMTEAAERGELNLSDAAYFKETIMEMLGFQTTLGRRFRESSAKATTAIYEKWFKQFAKGDLTKEWQLEELVLSDNIIGKLNEYFTISTQAFRMWVIPRNLTQVSLLGAVTGNRAAWDSFAYVVNNPKYINKVIERAVATDNLYRGTEAMTGPTKSWIEMSLSPLENSDMITRATAYRTAEVMIDKALPRYRKGITTGAEFLDEVSADIVDPAMQKQLLNMIDTGNVEGAKDILGMKLNNLTMFNYTKGSQGKAFRGVAGSLFGKLGTYPVGAISLYRDIVTRGSPLRAATRMARLAATTGAMYGAFNMVGIDYTGFLWTDPFEFSGGPYWVMLQDALGSLGRSQDSSMARARLFNSAARTAVPAGFRYQIDAIRYLSQGRPLEAALSMMTAPMQKSLKEYGVIESPFEQLFN